MRHRVGVPVDRDTKLSQLLLALSAGSEWPHRVLGAVAHEHRLRVGAIGERRRRLRRGGYVGRQRDQSGQWLASAQSGGEDDRTALREAGADDPRNRPHPPAPTLATFPALFAPLPPPPPARALGPLALPPA